MKRNLLVCSLIAVTGGAVVAQLSQGTTTPPQDTASNSSQLYSDAQINELMRIARADPDDASTRLRLGLMLEHVGRQREANRWFDEAVMIDSDLAISVLSPEISDHEQDGPVQTSATTGNEYPRSGPDVIVGRLYDLRRHGRVGNITAFSVGTESCNAGDENLLWISNTNQHPVISQHMYRLKDGRFEMIGHSWLKHGFLALSNPLCESMFGYSCQWTGGSTLGVGCSDPYSGSLNGSYSYLGPKHEVNAATGYFPYPYGNFPNNGPIGKRLQVHDDYLKPALNQGALYFMEGHYIAPDDAAAGNDLNNASYRRVNVFESSTNTFDLNWISGQNTVRELPAIYGWQEVDPTVTIRTADVPDDGRFILAYNVYDNGDGTWDYEFAMHNFNSDRSGRSFSVPVPQNVNVTNVEFHNVEWHSGAPYSEDPWSISHEDGKLTWQTQTYNENQNANALRWGTLYNFRFTADAAPEAADVTLGLFKPTAFGVNSRSFEAVGPAVPLVIGDLNGDGVVNVSDLLILLGQWGACSGCDADLNGDGVVNVSDLLILLANWG